MSIISQDPLGEPACPWSGIDGGPQHPAHEALVKFANRLYVTLPVVENSVDIETLELADEVGRIIGERQGMKLYQVIASPETPRPNYFMATYFRCLVCGFVLPAQEMVR